MFGRNKKHEINIIVTKEKENRDINGKIEKAAEVTGELVKTAALLGLTTLYVMADAEASSKVDMSKYNKCISMIDRIGLMDDFGRHTFIVETDLKNLYSECNYETKK